MKRIFEQPKINVWLTSFTVPEDYPGDLYMQGIDWLTSETLI